MLSRPSLNMKSFAYTGLEPDYVGELTRVWLVSGSVTWHRSLVEALLTAMPQLREASNPARRVSSLFESGSTR